MLRYMRLDLPASFRITGFRSQALALRDFVQGHYLDQIANLADQREKAEIKTETDEVVVRPTKLPWYPDGMAWQLNITRKDIRRDESFFKLHNFLISETESGNISRQETVSMIPPLVLDVKPHHKVLDMCAAPGSKTAQLIEALHQEEGVLPTGIVVANDADNARCYMLTHQAKRLQSPCLMITNHDASIMPNFYVKNDEKDSETKALKFDRILADVPCTGDGTMRKNPDIWQKWNSLNGPNLHSIQFRILKRAIELLEVGGRVVYSTCSLNPIEDESVVYRMLSMCEGAVQLVDASDRLPGLKYIPGLKTWMPADKQNNTFTSFEEVPENLKTVFRPHVFPPSAEEAEKLHLDRCIRVLPHLQNTGAFFVALLEKKAICPWEKQKQPQTAGAITED